MLSIFRSDGTILDVSAKVVIGRGQPQTNGLVLRDHRQCTFPLNEQGLFQSSGAKANQRQHCLGFSRHVVEMQPTRPGSIMQTRGYKGQEAWNFRGVVNIDQAGQIINKGQLRKSLIKQGSKIGKKINLSK